MLQYVVRGYSEWKDQNKFPLLQLFPVFFFKLIQPQNKTPLKMMFRVFIQFLKKYLICDRKYAKLPQEKYTYRHFFSSV